MVRAVFLLILSKQLIQADHHWHCKDTQQHPDRIDHAGISCILCENLRHLDNCACCRCNAAHETDQQNGRVHLLQHMQSGVSSQAKCVLYLTIYNFSRNLIFWRCPHGSTGIKAPYQARTMERANCCMPQQRNECKKMVHGTSYWTENLLPVGEGDPGDGLE